MYVGLNILINPPLPATKWIHLILFVHLIHLILLLDGIKVTLLTMLMAYRTVIKIMQRVQKVTARGGFRVLLLLLLLLFHLL